LGVRKTGLRACEVVDARRGGTDAVGERVDPPLPAKFEIVTATDQYAAEDGRRLVQDHRIEGGDPNRFPHTAAGTRKKPGEPRHACGLARTDVGCEAAMWGARTGETTL